MFVNHNDVLFHELYTDTVNRFLLESSLGCIEVPNFIHKAIGVNASVDTAKNELHVDTLLPLVMKMGLSNTKIDIKEIIQKPDAVTSTMSGETYTMCGSANVLGIDEQGMLCRDEFYKCECGILEFLNGYSENKKKNSKPGPKLIKPWGQMLIIRGPPGIGKSSTTMHTLITIQKRSQKPLMIVRMTDTGGYALTLLTKETIQNVRKVREDTALDFLASFSVSTRGILFLDGAQNRHRQKLSDFLASTCGPIVVTSSTGLLKFEVRNNSAEQSVSQFTMISWSRSDLMKVYNNIKSRRKIVRKKAKKFALRDVQNQLTARKVDQHFVSRSELDQNDKSTLAFEFVYFFTGQSCRWMFDKLMNPALYLSIMEDRINNLVVADDREGVNPKKLYLSHLLDTVETQGNHNLFANYWHISDDGKKKLRWRYASGYIEATLYYKFAESNNWNLSIQKAKEYARYTESKDNARKGHCFESLLKHLIELKDFTKLKRGKLHGYCNGSTQRNLQNIEGRDLLGDYKGKNFHYRSHKEVSEHYQKFEKGVWAIPLHDEPVFDFAYIFKESVTFFQATVSEKHSFSLDAITDFISNVNECLTEKTAKTKLKYGVFAMVVDHQAPLTLFTKRDTFGETVFDIKEGLPWAKKGSGKKSDHAKKLQGQVLIYRFNAEDLINVIINIRKEEGLGSETNEREVSPVAKSSKRKRKREGDDSLNDKEPPSKKNKKKKSKKDVDKE